MAAEDIYFMYPIPMADYIIFQVYFVGCHIWISLALCTNCILLFVVSEMLNTLRLRQNGRRFADDTFKRIFLNENARISIKISLKFVPKGPINNNPALVQIMAWRQSGHKPLSEPMMVSLPTHICVTRPQWVNKEYEIYLSNWNSSLYSFYMELTTNTTYCM